PKPVPSIFSSRPATERSRSTCTGLVGAVRYFEGRGLRCVTIFVITFCVTSDRRRTVTGDGRQVTGQNCFLLSLVTCHLSPLFCHHSRPFLCCPFTAK